MNKASEGTTRRVLLAEIVGVHGIRGEVVLRTYTADPGDVAAYGALTNEVGDCSYAIESLKSAGKKIVARFAAVRDRNAAEALRGTRLYVERTKLPRTADNEFYHVDLVGLVIESRDGKEIGRVAAVENFGAGDLLEIAPGGGGVTRYVAFTQQNVPEIDLDRGRVVVVIPDESGDKEPDMLAEGGPSDDGGGNS